MEERDTTVAGFLKRRVTRRQAVKAGWLVALGLIFSKPVITTFAPKPAFANYGEPGGTGCTPGFWKQARLHPWPDGFKPATTLFRDHFAIPSVFASSLDMRLYDLLNQGGGCEKALGRHGVAALLNAVEIGASGFGLSADQVRQMVNSALATEDCSSIESSKNTLVSFNEQACPLGGRIADF